MRDCVYSISREVPQNAKQGGVLEITSSISIYPVIQILCVCVCLSVTYRRPNCWTDHDQIWQVYADSSGNGSYLKKLVPRMVRKGGLIGTILRSGYLAGGHRALGAVAASR